MRDDDGYLWFMGRCDDVITSAGYDGLDELMGGGKYIEIK